MTGLVIFAHGSSVPEANEAVMRVTASMQAQGGYELVETAFLEPVRPTLGEAMEKLVARGASRVVVIPYFLTLGLHLQRDLPRIVSDLSRIHEGIPITVTEPLDGHPSLAAILLDRARAALES